MIVYYQFRYKNFRRPSGKRFYRLTGTEKQINEFVRRAETRKTHLRELDFDFIPAWVKKIADKVNLKTTIL